jgi:hydroxyacylglutathione hydrolase
LLSETTMRIHRATGVMSSSYVIEADGLFLIDAGFVGHAHVVLETIHAAGRELREVRLAIITHPHIDHCAGLAPLRRLAGFEVGCHPLAMPALAEGGRRVSPGLTPRGKLMELAGRLLLPWVRLHGVSADLALEDGADLHTFGLPGRVLHTPGHTDDCISVLLDDGTAFVGDLVSGPELGVRHPLPPAMAVGLSSVFASWRNLLDAGARIIYPAHGTPFPAEGLRALLERLS